MIESWIKRSFPSTLTTFHIHTLAWVNMWGTPTHKSTTALRMQSKHVYMFFLLAFTSPHTKWCYTDVYSGATLFNEPRQDLLQSCDLHPDLDGQASTGPRFTERRWLSTAELRCVCVCLGVSFDWQCTVGHPLVTHNMEVLTNPYTLAGHVIFFF